MICSQKLFDNGNKALPLIKDMYKKQKQWCLEGYMAYF